MKKTILIAAALLPLTACATSPKDFYANPSKANDTSLCRAVMDTKDTAFRQDAASELVRRGLTAQACRDKVNAQNGAIAAVALIGTAAAVGIAASGGGGGGYSPSRTDVDCYGGSGNGPLWQYGPIYVGSYDPHGLDADGDGWGCEISDRRYGA